MRLPPRQNGNTKELRLGSEDGSIHLAARLKGSWAEIVGPDGGTLVLTPRAAGALATWLNEWALPERQIEAWSVADIAREYKVAPPTVYHWLRKPDFPTPLIATAQGRIWDSEQVRGWVKHRKRKRGRQVKRLKPVSRAAQP